MIALRNDGGAEDDLIRQTALNFERAVVTTSPLKRLKLDPFPRPPRRYVSMRQIQKFAGIALLRPERLRDVDHDVLRRIPG